LYNGVSNYLEYIDLEITKSNIEIRGDGYELTYFFDTNDFELNYKNLILAFFRGEYKVLTYLNKKGIKEAFSVIWNNENLKRFNNKEGVFFSQGAIRDKLSKDGLEIIS
jgi:hypothetical protein